MNIRNAFTAALLALSSSGALFAQTEDFDATLEKLQEDWAEVQYEVDADKRVERFEILHERAQDMIASYPDRAEPLIWDGIILSTWAGARGGLGALSLVKQAKVELEKAIELDPAALDGSAYTSLGSLYYQVPGWPLGFGNDEKAASLLSKALTINPNGIDANYFYGDYLLEEGDKHKARQYLNKALEAPARPGRPIADKGRRKDIQEKLEQLDS